MAMVRQSNNQGSLQPLQPGRDSRIAARLRRTATGLLGTLAFTALAIAGPLVPPARCDEAHPGEPHGGDAHGELELLLAGFAALPGLSAQFQQERHLSLLQEPLVSSGVLYFAPPDRLLQRVDEPVESALLVNGDRLTFSGPGGLRTIELDSHPFVRAFVDSARLLLAGNLDSLRETYGIGFEAAGSPTAREWRIRLRPLTPPLVETVAAIEVRGRGQTLHQFRLEEVRGDETVTRFSGVDTTRRFDDGELAELFHRPGP
jgi:hypothetical protein